MFATRLSCIQCSAKYQLRTRYKCAKCGGILDVAYDYETLKKDRLHILSGPNRGRNMWKFKDLLPLSNEDSIVSLDEGNTPLFLFERLSKRLIHSDLYLKDETRNPTGSFKDRPVSCAISKAKEEGKTTVITSSTGNAGISVAAYAARAGMKAIVIAPSNAPKSKLSSIVCLGAELIRLRGTYSDCFKIANELTEEYDWVNLTSTFLNPFATEGDKTISYELFIQSKEIPDWILVPIGSGPLLVGIYKGYKELKDFGIIDKLPSMVGVQARGCAPIAEAFENKRMKVRPWKIPKTIASSIADPLVGYANDGTLTLNVIRESGGVAIGIDDKNLIDAVKQLSMLGGLFAEPTGAASIAALSELKGKGIIDKDDLVVCVITGSGFKDYYSVEKIAQIPSSELRPRMKEVRAFVQEYII